MLQCIFMELLLFSVIISIVSYSYILKHLLIPNLSKFCEKKHWFQWNYYTKPWGNCNALGFCIIFMRFLLLVAFFAFIIYFAMVFGSFWCQNQVDSSINTLFQWDYHPGTAPARVEECCTARTFCICSCSYINKLHFKLLIHIFCNSFLHLRIGNKKHLTRYKKGI